MNSTVFIENEKQQQKKQIIKLKWNKNKYTEKRNFCRCTEFKRCRATVYDVKLMEYTTSVLSRKQKHRKNGEKSLLNMNNTHTKNCTNVFVTMQKRPPTFFAFSIYLCIPIFICTTHNCLRN